MAVTKTRKAAPFERFMAYRRFSAGLAFTPDAQHVYFVGNMSGQFNLWRVPVESGWPEQLTTFTDDTVRVIGVSPTDGSVVLCADHDGDEFHQLYLIRPDDPWPEKITDAPEVQHYVGGDAFSPDGTKLAYAANARTPADMEVWVRDLAGGDTRSVFGEGMYAFPGPWSPDGTKLVTLDFRNNSDSSIHLVDLESGETRELTPHDDEGLYFPGPWTADGGRRGTRRDREPDGRPQRGHARRRRADLVSLLRRPRHSRVAVPPDRGRRTCPRRSVDSRRTGGTGASALPAAVPVLRLAWHR